MCSLFSLSLSLFLLSHAIHINQTSSLLSPHPNASGYGEGEELYDDLADSGKPPPPPITSPPSSRPLPPTSVPPDAPPPLPSGPPPSKFPPITSPSEPESNYETQDVSLNKHQIILFNLTTITISGSSVCPNLNNYATHSLSLSLSFSHTQTHDWPSQRCTCQSR